MMTIGELVAQLTAMDLPDDTPVVVQKDAEGNGFSPLADLGLGLYEAESTWAGERIDFDEIEADQMYDTEGAVTAVFLEPTN